LDVLGEETAGDLKLVAEVANVGIERYANGGSWPCGTGSGETPSLMLGFAGIGHFYLRLHSQKIPSILIPRREEFCNAGIRRNGQNGDCNLNSPNLP
jgi:hypothetical protein